MSQYIVMVEGIGLVFQDTSEDMALLAYAEWFLRSFCDPDSDCFNSHVHLYRNEICVA